MCINWRSYLKTPSVRPEGTKVGKALEEKKQFHTKSKPCWRLLQMLKRVWWRGSFLEQRKWSCWWGSSAYMIGVKGDHTGKLLSAGPGEASTRWIYGSGLRLHWQKHLEPFRQTSWYPVCDRTITTAHFEERWQFGFTVYKRRFLLCFWVCF